MRKGHIQSQRARGALSGALWLAALLWPAALAIFSCILLVSSAAAQSNPKNVLVVFSTFERDPVPMQLIGAAVRARAPGQVNFYTAFLDHQRFESDPSYRDRLAESIRSDYKQTKLDAVIAAGTQALQLATQAREKTFPGVPIIFFGLSASELQGMKPTSGTTGVTTSPGLRETIDLALRLNPDTTAIAVVDAAPAFWWRVAHTELLRRQERVKEIDILGPPGPQMLERVTGLPPHTVVLFQLAPASSDLPAIGAFDVLNAASQHLPTYSAWRDLCMNHGCIGGAYRDWRQDDSLAGDMAGRLLEGERLSNIPIVDTTNVQIQVDWRELQHWHIPESALPAASAILYRPPSIWQSYRRYVIAAVIVIAVLLLLITGLLWERARKRKAEAQLRESEKRFRVMADTTPSLVWMSDPNGKIIYLNERRVEFTGPDPRAGYGDTWSAYVHPDDVKNVKDGMWQGKKDHQSFSREYRLRRSDGVYRWMFDVASPRLNGDGSFAGFIGSAIDVTEQKLAQQTLEQVSGQLIEAQEKERRRIARDLHDDICQRLALLSMEIDHASRAPGSSSGDGRHKLEAIRQHCSEIAGDVQSLSHQLHSSRLEYLGLATAIRGFCEEFSRQHDVTIDLREGSVSRDLPEDVSLCLFRVTQEALHNALKYSGVSHFTVELTPGEEEVELLVSDSGKGFDVEQAKQKRGLGLVSMQERVHLVRGSLYIESQPGEGTSVLAVVPIPRENSLSPTGASPEHAAGARSGP